MNLYELLGIGKRATPAEVKRAYRAKARETHPDRGGDNNAFAEVNHAYQVLRDDRKRKVYDQTGDNTDLGDQRARMLEECGRLVYGIIEQTQDVSMTDVLATAARAVQAATQQHLNGKRDLQAKIRKIKVALKRLKKRDGGVNPLAAMIETNLRSHEVGIIQIDAAVARNEVMLDLISQYEYAVEAPKPKTDQEARQQAWYEAMARQPPPMRYEAAPAARRRPVETPPPPPPEPRDPFERDLEL